MKTRLINYREGAIDLMFALDRPRNTIGRDVDNMIQLVHDEVSKHHAAILQNKGAWTIEDLNSRNGVLVNGKRVVRAELKDGDTVKIGPFMFNFEVNVPEFDWVPAHIVELGTQIRHHTIFENRPDGRS